MQLETWLDERRGRTSELAAHFGITQGAISQWRSSGVPLDRMKAVQAFTQGAVTLDEMVPAPTNEAKDGRTERSNRRATVVNERG